MEATATVRYGTLKICIRFGGELSECCVKIQTGYSSDRLGEHL